MLEVWGREDNAPQSCHLTKLQLEALGVVDLLDAVLVAMLLDQADDLHQFSVFES